MAKRQPTSLLVRGDQPLIAIPLVEDGEEVTRYFADEADADAFLAQQHVIKDALATAGAFSDLDWEETLDALDRIRHESKPTPPIDLDL